MVSTLIIQQSDDSAMRAKQVRVENSDDGITWKRVDVINLKDDGNLNTYGVRQSWPANKWRIIPTMFNGAMTNTPWEVFKIEMLDDTQLSIDSIQDMLLLENRDRDYLNTSICMKVYYDVMEETTQLALFGIDLPTQYTITIPFNTMIEKLGRPIVTGDIIEIPTEAQYDHNLKAVRKWLEVSDTTWSNDGRTVDWKPKLFRITAQPLIISQENYDLFGSADAFCSMFLEMMSPNNPISVSSYLKSVSEALSLKSSADPKRS
jgi:hypothetical protein